MKKIADGIRSDFPGLWDICEKITKMRVWQFEIGFPSGYIILSTINNNMTSTTNTTATTNNIQKPVTNPMADALDGDLDIPAFLRKSNKK